MRALCGLWRWRHNPLRRGTDRAEAWLALLTLVLIAVVAPLAGVAAGGAAEHALQQSVRDQHRDRHEVVATVVRKLSRAPLEPDPEASSAQDPHSRVLADWTAPDGSAHRGRVVTVLRSPHRGDHFALWTDRHGHMVGRPLDAATATTHAVLAGIGAALMTVVLLEAARRLVLWRMVLGRYARWDQAWDRAGPDWGRTGAGS
ncbi:MULTISPECIES: Rv1733c family protein [unclassified Streptomyces]|uniref:Rv1733c family protein n=1 Tax=unclassified Streptomyces TaxID=2593676 RepID=UPI0011CD58E5|nr:MULTISPECIES: hypothetical protein [unclassified Streptomyces]TXS64310.1 hypothetical protein EAO69_31595 [Streptomyces sp. me109]